MNTANKLLCKGYATSRIDYAAGEILETLFAVYPDGRVAQSVECARHSSFLENRTWNASSKTAADIRADPEIEFIGNYYMPA